MKYFFLLPLVLFIACTQEPPPSQGTTGGNGNYDFTDLSPSENLLDSAYVYWSYGQYGTSKFYYANKQTISSIKRNDLVYKGLDSFYYSTNILDSVVFNGRQYDIGGSYVDTKLWTNFQYGGGLKTRAYSYDDSHPNPLYRQLGSYIYYQGQYVDFVANRFINNSGLRDSTLTKIKRKPNGDVDSVYISQGGGLINNPSHYLRITFEYGGIMNKLKGNANLKNLLYSYQTREMAGLGIRHIRPVDYYLNMNYNFSDDFTDAFNDVLFNNTILPEKFNVCQDVYPYTTPYYIRYTYNYNNYITSVTISSTPGFDPVNAKEVLRLSYYRHP